MNRIPYTGRPAGLVGPAYCDTSFLLDLLASRQPARMGPNPPPQVVRRVADVSAFHAWAVGGALPLCTSILALEEAYHLLHSRPLGDACKTHQVKKWKDLRRNNQAAFAIALGQSRAAISDFQAVWTNSGIALLGWAPGEHSLLVRYARAILNRLEIDAMDAFHYAVMRSFGLGVAVSSDRDWIGLPHGDLVTG